MGCGIQIGTDILSVLICVQTVCKGYQQMTKVAASKEIVNGVLSVLHAIRFMRLKMFLENTWVVAL